MQSAWRTVRLQTDPHGVELWVGICNEVESFLLNACVVCATLHWLQECAPVENTRHIEQCNETLVTDLGDGRVKKILKEMTDTDNKTRTIRETHQNIINRVTTSMKMNWCSERSVKRWLNLPWINVMRMIVIKDPTSMLIVVTILSQIPVEITLSNILYSW